MKLSAVIVAYNPTKSINNSINSFIDFVDKLFVIDNSDTNNEKIFNNGKIEYIPNYENKGIAFALNLAAKKSYELGYKWILTMDQDSIFKDDNLTKLISFVEKNENDKIGIVSPWHKTKENKKRSINEYDSVVEVMTSGNIVNLSAWKKIGGWKESYFIDNVDIEFCMNLNINHFSVIQYNNAELEHNLGNITKKKLFNKTFTCTNHNYIRQYYMIRNLYYLSDEYKKYFPDNIYHMKRGAFGRFKNILIWEKDKYRKIRNMYRGYRDYKKKIIGKYPYKN